MNKGLTNFLRHNHASTGIMAHLNSLGAEMLEQAWEKASPEDLVWAVTRPGIMSPEQRRLFLVMVLESIEDKLTDPRSKNILEKLRTKSPITEVDVRSAYAAAGWADVASYAASYAAAAAARAVAATWVEAKAVEEEVRVAVRAAEATWAAAAAAVGETWEKQAHWIRSNFKLADLHTN